jgi:hypothetical protein
MKRFTLLIVLFAFVVGVSAFGYTPENVSPTGALDWMVYDLTDAFGDVMNTIPLANPGPSNAWVGGAYVDGYLYLLKNVASPQGTNMVKIDASNGNVIDEFTILTGAYCMGCSYDGSGFWVAKWYTSNAIYKFDMDGNIVSQFTPSTGAYSCRMVEYEGGNLWVGANSGSNVTNLYKMTTTGSILETYSTNTAVGWYMGGAICTEAASGQNLFIIDNVGNSLKRLQVSGGTVTIMESVNSPAVSPDVAEGLAFDGQYLWHWGAYAYQQLIQVDDGVTGTPMDVTVTLTPVSLPIVIPAGGGSFDFNIEVSNNEASTVGVSIWTMIELPNGSMYGPVINASPNLGAGVTVDRDRTQNVPANAPAGSYTYYGYTGMYPAVVWDEDSFPFSKSTDGDGGALVSDWNNWGEDFGDLEGVAASVIPDEYALYNAYPNPFNPQTTISFALKESGKVTLKIYNIMGEEIATLVDGFMEAGVHEMLFKANNLSSGIYLYSIQADDFTAVKKMTLLK